MVFQHTKFTYRLYRMLHTDYIYLTLEHYIQIVQNVRYDLLLLASSSTGRKREEGEILSHPYGLFLVRLYLKRLYCIRYKDNIGWKEKNLGQIVPNFNKKKIENFNYIYICSCSYHILNLIIIIILIPEKKKNKNKNKNKNK